MCYDGAVERAAGPAATPGTPGRRAFNRLLAAGTGLAALSACTPEGSRPTSSAAAAPSATTAGSSATAPATTSAAPPAGPAPGSPAATEPATTPPTPAPSSTAPRARHSLTDPASPWVVVNKHRPLSPADFAPADLVQPRVRLATSGEAALLHSTTAAAAEEMFSAAAAGGVAITLASGYRSFSTQIATYNKWVAAEGQAGADTASARPGYSEHQTGWSFDIGDGSGQDSFTPAFANQPAALWAKANAHKFGFVVRYPWMFHETTGYYYEPWHLRFVGVEAAGDMNTHGVATLEEYFGLEAAPGYL